MEIQFKLKNKLFRLSEVSHDEKFKYLYSLTILNTFVIGFLFLTLISILVDAVILFILGLLVLGVGFALFFAIKRFNIEYF